MKKLIAVLLTALLVSGLVACGGGSASSAAPAESKAEESKEESKAEEKKEESKAEESKEESKAEESSENILGHEAAKEGKLKNEEFTPIRDASETDGTIYCVPKSTNSKKGFWGMVGNALELHANSVWQEELDGHKVVQLSPDNNTDGSLQITLIETAMANEPLALVVAPVDHDAPVSILEEAYDKGIPVILFDDSLNSSKYDYQYSTDSYGAARGLAAHLAKQIEGDALYCTMSGSAQAGGEEARLSGFKDELDENFKNLKHVEGGSHYSNYKYDESYNYLKDMLTKYPNGEIKLVLATFNNITNAAIVAVQEAGLNPGDILIGAFDSDADAEVLCEEGWMSAILQQTPYEITKNACIRGMEMGTGKLERSGVPGFEEVHTLIITPETILGDEAQAFLHPIDFDE